MKEQNVTLDHTPQNAPLARYVASKHPFLLAIGVLEIPWKPLFAVLSFVR